MAPQASTTPSGSASGNDEPPRKVLIVTVIVGTGEAQQIFILHGHLLRESYTFFENALKGEWKECNKKTVRLPEASALAFAGLARFLYIGYLFVDRPKAPVTLTDTKVRVIFAPSLCPAIISNSRTFYKHHTFEMHLSML